jgi:hypothetical membrane protein
MRLSDSKIAGLFLLVAVTQFILFLEVAQDLYPGYSISQNYVSDLGATCNAVCVIHQPTATIFDSSIAVLGAMLIISSYFMQRSFGMRILTTFVFLTGMGAIGVGIFPETTGILHTIVSAIAFIFGGLAAIASYRVVRLPLGYLSIFLGLLILVDVGLYKADIFLGLGAGGMERMIVYPEMTWGLTFGGFLLNSPMKSSEEKVREVEKVA